VTDSTHSTDGIALFDPINQPYGATPVDEESRDEWPKCSTGLARRLSAWTEARSQRN